MVKFQIVKLISLKMHLSVKYQCHQCDYEAKHKYRLNEHIQSKHEGVRYPCDLCSFKSSSKSSLKLHVKCHVESMHEGAVTSYFDWTSLL